MLKFFFELQASSDSGVIQVGSLVGLMVSPGEDWENVIVPGIESNANATSNKAASKPIEETAHATESHLQMLVF